MKYKNIGCTELELVITEGENDLGLVSRVELNRLWVDSFITLVALKMSEREVSHLSVNLSGRRFELKYAGQRVSCIETALELLSNLVHCRSFAVPVDSSNFVLPSYKIWIGKEVSRVNLLNAD